MASSLEEIEARVAVLEAEQADYRAVLAAINALGANQRDLVERVTAVEAGLAEVRRGQQDVGVRVRSLEEGFAEVKDLLIRALDR